jgi:hypothetical protein
VAARKTNSDGGNEIERGERLRGGGTAIAAPPRYEIIEEAAVKEDAHTTFREIDRQTRSTQRAEGG